MEDGLPVRLLAFVALETALLHELLSLRAKRSVVGIGQLPFMRFVDGVPPGADVDATRQTDLAAGLQDARGGTVVVAVQHGSE